MLTENTITKLQEMRLSAMAAAFKEQLTDPNIAELSFEDRFGLLVDKEWLMRKNNHLTRLIKNARFSQPNACGKYFIQLRKKAGQGSDHSTGKL